MKINGHESATAWLSKAVSSLSGMETLDVVLEHALAATVTLTGARRGYAFVERQGIKDGAVSLYRSVPSLPDAEIRDIAARSGYRQARCGDDFGDTHCLALIVRGRTLGAILLQGVHVNAEQRPALQVFATLTAAILDNLVLSRNEWTGLPNLPSLRPMLRQFLYEAQQPLALFFLDIDDFKSVNSRTGYMGGAEFLIQFSKRLTTNQRLKAGRFAHISGDEFLYVLPLATRRGDVQVAECIKAIEAELELPFVIDGMEIAATASIGVSVYPDDAKTVEELLTHSARAILQAKSSEKGGCRIYRPSFETADS